MEIVPPADFKDGRGVKAQFTRYDPRIHSFPSPDVVINLKECTNIQPPAMLWCLVYLKLWQQRGYNCLLILPDSEKATAALIECGMLAILKEQEIQVFGNCREQSVPADVISPLTRFDGLREAAELTNTVEYSLYTSGFGAANIHPIVCELFSELVNNAAEHSESGIGAYGLIRFYSFGEERRFVCGVADGGVGIQEAIERNARLEHSGYEWSAIELATKELVSGTSSPTRGIGLFSVLEEMRPPGRELLIHSGRGVITVSEDSQIRMIRANLFPGTLVYFSIPT